MPRLPELVARVRPRTRLAAAVAAAALVAVVAGVVTVVGARSGDDALSRERQGVDVARVGQPSSTATATPSSTAAPTTTPAAPTTTTTVAPTTVPPIMTDPPPTTAAVVPEPAAAAPAPGPPGDARCLVRLHGQGGGGSGVANAGDVVVISPSGNAPGWGGRQWLYFAPGSYGAALSGVAQAVVANGCGQVIVNGFSNGGAFAVKLYCRGESFGGRLVGVVADDPVPDHGADGCAPPAGVPLTMYWTGALDATAKPGWDCAAQDWTCEGGTTVGLDAYAASAGATVTRSPFGNHQWYMDAPELGAWR